MQQIDTITVTIEELEAAIEKLKAAPAPRTRREALRKKLQKKLDDMRRSRMKLRDLSELEGMKQVEDRILRAWKTLIWLPDHELHWLFSNTSWPKVLKEYSDLVGAEPVGHVNTFSPSPADIDDMFVAFRWLQQAGKTPELKKRYQRLFMWRSFGFSWRTVADRMGVTEWRVTSWRKDALIMCRKAALHDD